MSFLEAMFRPNLPARAFRMRTTYILRTEAIHLGSEEDVDIMGVLEFTQDITQDIREIVRFVWLSVAASLVSSVMLLILLQFIIRRAEQVLSARIQEQQRLERGLHQHEKLVSMGRMVASIAHEVRNPLGIICSSAELLLSRNKDSDKVMNGLLEAIHDESQRLSRTVTDFLDYARPRQPRGDSVDINAQIEQALIFLQPVLEKNNISLDCRLEPGLIAKGDKELLYRAFYNVLINAVQAMQGRPAGSLTVRGSKTTEGIDVCIRDQGPGFDPAQFGHVLDPFFTTKDDGTGLGLAIVNSIMTSHGGRLHLTNAEQGGALVAIHLPAA
jgi:signal transduction histidine kinase